MNYVSALQIGDLLIRPKAFGIVDHHGVVVDRDTVLQNTPEKGEHLATVQEFSDGKSITVHRTEVNPTIVEDRVRNVLAKPRGYDLIFRNCQHTATEIIGGIAKSPQVAILFIIAACILIMMLISLSRR